MNHIHQIIWNKTLGIWTVASELAKRGKKRSSIRRNALLLPLLLHTSASFGLPTGNELVAGSANVTTPSAEQMQINQSSQQAIINWQGFSIAGHESVNIQQPNVNAALLNRVVGQDASSIQGRLNANGQVYLTNPNGVIFSKTAQVDVGGLIASTHAISNQDFLNNKLHFTQNNATGSVINHGQIKTPEGGIVALIGEQVENTGSINTPKGTTALAAGKTVDLDMQGDGLVEVKITEAAINAQINNAGIIQADGGQVIMTAQAAGQLLSTVINNNGIVEARGLVEKNGKIVLSGGDNGVVQVSGTLDTSGRAAVNNVALNESGSTPGGNITVSGEQIHISSNAKLNASGDAGGGTIVIGDKQSTSQTTIEQNASLAAQTRDHGKAGTIEVLANMDNGVVKVKGQLDASAPKNGDGGFIDTSAAQVQVADTAKITTQATNGKSGTWLIDPADFTIGSTAGGTVTAGTPSGDISGATLSTALASGQVTILSTQGSTLAGSGNINVNDEVAWSVNKLTLNALNNININANLNASDTASLALIYGQGAVALNNTSSIITTGAAVNLPAGKTNFTTLQGSDGIVNNYTVITILGDPGSETATDLQGMNGNLKINYALGTNINATETSATDIWGETGFNPVGGGSIQSPFTGNFEGLGHTITGLTIKRPTTDNVGLFGRYFINFTDTISNPRTISNIGLVGGSIEGRSSVGGLVGDSFGNIISNSYATGSVTGTNNVGGLVGSNSGTISDAFATGRVIGESQVGGLVGNNSDTISDAFATGSVSGTGNVGGLVGSNSDTISDAYATGSVTGTNNVGGLVGSNFLDGSISNSHYDIDQVVINGSHFVTVGGIYHNQFQDWFSHDKTLNIANYAATLPLDGTSGYNSIDSLQGMKDLLGFVDSANYNFRLSADINLAAAPGFFIPSLAGKFDGAGHIISNLAVNQPFNENIGMFGHVLTGGAVNNLGLTDVNISGRDVVGGLVGINFGSINNAYATGSVTGINDVGGLVGENDGSISNAYAMSSVTGNFILDADGDRPNANAGGLVGNNSGTISNAYATGSVSGTNNVGGLVGFNLGTISNTYATGPVTGTSAVGGLVGENSAFTGGPNGNISNAYATGSVTGTNNVGGLVGSNFLDDRISNAFWDTQSTGQGANGVGSANVPGATGKTPAEMKQLTTFSNAGWDISGTGGSAAVWRIYEGNTTPLLRSFLTPLTVTANADSKIYDGLAYTGGNGVTYTDFANNEISNVVLNGILSYSGTSQGAINAGAYVISPIGLYSDQQGYDISLANGALTIASSATLTYTADPSTRAYGAANPPFTGTVTGFVSGDTQNTATTGTAIWTSPANNLSNVGSYAINGSGLAAINGNYQFTQAASNATALSITPVTLTAAIINNPTKTYDSTTAATLAAINYNLTGFVGGQGASVTQTVGAYDSKNVNDTNNITVNLAAGDFSANAGTLLSNYKLPDSAKGPGRITPANLSITANDISKTYDGTLTANSTPVAASGSSLFGTDSLSGGSFAFTDKNAGTGKTVTVDNVTVNDGNNGGNYTVSYANNIKSIITPYAVNLTGTRAYDRTTNVNANIFTFGQLVGNETLTLTGTGTVADPNIGDNKTVTLNTLALGDGSNGGLAGNYTFAGGSQIASITPANLIMAAIVGSPSKVYDGSVTAFLSSANYSLTGFVPNEGATVTKTTGTYDSKNVNVQDVNNINNINKINKINNITVNLADGDFSANAGTLLSNYTLPKSATGEGRITPANLSITANDVSKTYDGTKTANSTPVAASGSSLFGTDSLSGGSFAFTDKNAGTGKTVTVDNVTVNDGNNGNNYTVGYADNTNSTITPYAVNLTGTRVFDGTTIVNAAIFTFGQLVGNETLTLTGAGTVADAAVSNNKPVILNTLALGDGSNGGLAGNYSFVGGTQTASITSAVTPDAVRDNIVTQQKSVTYQPPLSSTQYEPASSSVLSVSSVKDTTEDFAGLEAQYSGLVNQYCGSSTSIINPMVNCQKWQKNQYSLILPTLKIKNSAGRVKRLQMSANKQFLSLLLEDGSVRIWDFQRGKQHQIVTQNKSQALTDISAVDDKGELLSIASKTGIGTQDVIIPTLADKLAIDEPDSRHFMTSNDGSLLLVSAGSDQLSLWDSKQNKMLWQLPYERGTVNGLALTDNKHYGAVLSRQPGSYVLLPTDLQLKSLTDAVDIVDLGTGKVIKSLPNVGEQILSIQFTDNDTLQLKLASGQLLDWPIAMGSQKTVANFAETITAVDTARKTYTYVLEDGTVRVGDGQGHVLLSIQNKKNPFKDAMLLEGDKKLLTVMTNGELSLWDVASGKKMLRLFSTQQGWTVMDAFGRFDGSEEAMDNFSWTANEEDIPLDSFSENYYEPGLLSNVIQNQDYLNRNPDMVKNGITLPPKVVLQIAEQQAKGDRLALQLDVYDRGGGIDKIHVYQNGKILSNEKAVVAQQSLQENAAEHRVLTLNVTPNAGKNTLKVVASNDMGIENSSTELTFDGKTKAYASSLRLLTIGIDQYSDDKLNLKYSVADADLIEQAIKNTSKIAASVNLTNENATKPKILAELKELSQGVQQDVLVIYFAGHGLALGKEWYFLPYETKMQPSLEKIAATGITATELSDIFKGSKIQHILLMVDSCYSGAGMDAFSKLQNGQRYFTRRLSRSLGITVMTAAVKDQKAFELKSLGHGLFTYLITQELQAKDATQPITAHSIAENIAKTLPVFSKKMLGSSQEPAVYVKGNDFMLTDVLKASNKGNASDSNTPAIVPKKPAQ